MPLTLLDADCPAMRKDQSHFQPRPARYPTFGVGFCTYVREVKRNKRISKA